MKRVIVLFIILFVTLGSSHARINPKLAKKDKKQIKLREGCEQGDALIVMDVNNVRATLLNSGDIWWDRNQGQYIVPNTPPGIPDVSSIYAGAVWIGGYDQLGNLKIAANTYTNSGNTDFFPGPLNDTDGTTTEDNCRNWDEFFQVFGNEIDFHRDNIEAGNPNYTIDSVPDNIRYWPGKGNSEFPLKYGFPLPDNAQGLGSFEDVDDDGLYNPLNGDFPKIEIRGCAGEAQYPDEMIFWIYNDAGNVHQETTGEQIQMEVQVQAFAYRRNDEINDMTFQRYKLINRAQTAIQDCYFAMWVDSDLGCHTDDYIGCDIGRSLMYTYNEDNVDGTAAGSCECDGGANTYCNTVPILGVDYFRGPLQPIDIVDNPVEGGQDTLFVEDGDDIYYNVIFNPSIDPDTFWEIGMSSFAYYNNGGVGDPLPGTTDPDNPIEYYNYMDGKWRDGTPFTFGGAGYNLGSTDTIRYAFTGDPSSDNDWNMCVEDLPFGDRRTVQASGPFLLTTGAINELIIGVVWVPDLVYPCPELVDLRKADDLAQALFDNCFDILEGPDAPDVEYVQLDREIILFLTNDTIGTNNAYEEYQEIDIYATDSLAKGPDITEEDISYLFEGYMVYQLRTPNSTSSLYDIEEARLVRQVDLMNGVTTLYNWTGNINPSETGQNEIIYESQEMVDGSDEGILHSFRITEDAFGQEDGRLINHREYYFFVIAYGYNEYAPFQPKRGLGQRTPFITGSGNTRVLTLVPRPMVYDQLNSYYGDGPIVTRMQGVGNQGQFMELDDSMHDMILENNKVDEIVYKEAAGPLRVEVVNPLGVQDGEFELEIEGEFSSETGELEGEGSSWKLTDLNTGTVYRNYRELDTLEEIIISDYGFSVKVGIEPDLYTKVPSAPQGDFIGATMDFSDAAGGEWMSFVPNGSAPLINYINTDAADEYDKNRRYRNTAGLGMFPIKFAEYRGNTLSPGDRTNAARMTQAQERMDLELLPNVDIVLTSDKDKWSKCIVLEISSPEYFDFGYEQEGNSVSWEVRDHPSVGKDADGDGKPKELDDGTTGFGYFPGYAINVETGERLNIFFAENSVYGGDVFNDFLEVEDIGRDMMFNPSSQALVETPPNFPANAFFANFLMGGQHWMYVSNTPYDGCDQLRDNFKQNASNGDIFKGSRGLGWTGLPMTNDGFEMLSYDEGLIPNDVTIKLRHDNTFGQETSFNNGVYSYVDENPKYHFAFEGKEAVAVTEENISEALMEVNVVPNPYYAYSEYEVTQNDSRVKITNVPQRSTITIYSLDGRFITQFKRDARRIATNGGALNFLQEGPNVVWNIKNSKGIPVASGVYLIHVTDEDTGTQRTLKWFGVNRKFDPSGL